MAPGEREPRSQRFFWTSFPAEPFGMGKLEARVSVTGLSVAGLAVLAHAGPVAGLLLACFIAILVLVASVVKIEEISLVRLLGRALNFAWRLRAGAVAVRPAGTREAHVFQVALSRSPYLSGESGRSEYARRFTTLLDSLARLQPAPTLAVFHTSRGPMRSSTPATQIPVADQASYEQELLELEGDLLGAEEGPRSYVVLLPEGPGKAHACLRAARGSMPEVFSGEHTVAAGNLESVLPRSGRFRERFSCLSAAGHKVVIYSVSRLPRSSAPGALGRLLIAPPSPFVAGILFAPGSPDRLVRKVRVQRTRLRANVRINSEAGFLLRGNRGLFAGALSETEAAVDAGRAAVTVGMLVLCWQDDGERGALVSAFSRQGFLLRREFGRQAEALGALSVMAGGR